MHNPVIFKRQSNVFLPAGGIIESTSNIPLPMIRSIIRNLIVRNAAAIAIEIHLVCSAGFWDE
jgi:hypothetical protein